MKFRYLLIVLMAIVLAACDSADDAAMETSADEVVVIAEDEAVTEETIEELEELAEEEADIETDEQQEIVLSSSEAQKPALRTDWKYKEGEYYRRLTTSQGTSSAPDKIEVAEIFWYGCPHCYDFDPVLKEWEAGLSDDVAFVKIPVIWNPTNQIHARIMYTAESLGKLDEMHAGIFNAIHQQGKSLTSESELIAFFAKYDVNEAQFREVFNSFGVSSNVKRAENLTRRYGIRSVPVIVVNGKYVTDGPSIKSFDDVLGVTGELVERERYER